MRIRCIIMLLATSLLSNAQIFQYNKFWIEFTDKANSPFTVERPEEFLSAKAIERRVKQNITIDETDIPVVSDYIKAVKNSGVKILNKSKWFNAVSIETTDSAALSLIASLPFVKNISIASAIILPDTSKIDSMSIESFDNREKKSVVFDTEGTQNNVYGNSLNQINMMAGDYLHELGFKGEGMTIAVLDAGFSRIDQLDAFDSLWANNQILGAFDFVEVDDSAFHGSNHGMSVLSIMGGNLQGQLVGTAPKADYWLLRTEDVSSEYRIEEFNWIAAAELADSAGADVINSSLGYSTFNDSVMDYSYEAMDGNTAWITRGADMAARKGMIVVSSAGNLGSSSWRYISAPADGDSVFTIGAVGPSGHYASFSSQGPTFDDRVKPNVVAQGVDDIIANPGNDVSQGNGTSFASPLVAGLVACFWQANPDLKNMEVIKKIEESASSYSDPTDTLGYGIPNFLEAQNKLLEKEGRPYVRSDLPLAYPNPFTDQLNVLVYAKLDGKAVIRVFDNIGRSIYSEERFISKNRFSKFDLSNIGIHQKGMYIIRVVYPRNSACLRVMKL